MTRAESYLASLGRFGTVPDLGRIQRLLTHLGDPHRRYAVVHVAGTNGKGSVCTMLAGALQAAGFRTGLYTSPHLHRFHERIVVDGVPISDAALDAAMERVRAAVDAVLDASASGAGPSNPMPTQFDVGTAMAFVHFAEAEVDVAVIETGMGGLWDSTNVVWPTLTVITPIDIDHADVLGDTMRQVARQKAGILKEGVPVVLAPQSAEAMEELLSHAAAAKASVVSVEPAPGHGEAATTDASQREMPLRRVRFEAQRWDRTGGQLAVEGLTEGTDGEYEVGLLGEHQLLNAAVVVAAVDELRRLGWAIPEAALRTALRTARVPGRLEVFAGTPTVLFDGAHNGHAARELGAALGRLFPGTDITLVCSISKDKDPQGILMPLIPHANRFIFTASTDSRLGVWQPAELEAILQRLAPSSPRSETRLPAIDAMKAAIAGGPRHGLVCVCGSLYLVGELRSHWIAEQGVG